ncbi:MAG: AAC(3) family N-acetyltransferase [candidate division WOR-3 bacterium]
MVKENLKRYISENGNDHILIHSDILFGFKIPFVNHDFFLKEHYKELKAVCQPLKIIMPSFNYDFCKGSIYNMKESESQVGSLSEYFRKNMATWRTSTPVFNFSGIGENPILIKYGKIDPFDKSSIFGFLHKNKGILMHYGSGFHTSTLIHYVERISNRLIYRYDKLFKGQVIDVNGVTHECELIYHVRPKGYALDYDWGRIEEDLIENELIEKYKQKRTQILIGRIDKIVDFWLSRLNDNPFYFLHKDTRNWVEAKYNELNRPFELTDFE